jgi:hypothetical protein
MYYSRGRNGFPLFFSTQFSPGSFCLASRKIFVSVAFCSVTVHQPKQGASVAGVSLRNFRFEQRTSMALKSLPSFFPSGVERPKNPYSRRFQVPNSKFSLLYFGPRGASREYNQSSSLPVPSTSHHYLEANFLKRRNVRWQGGSE